MKCTDHLATEPNKFPAFCFRREANCLSYWTSYTPTVNGYHVISIYKQSGLVLRYWARWDDGLHCVSVLKICTRSGVIPVLQHLQAWVLPSPVGLVSRIPWGLKPGQENIKRDGWKYEIESFHDKKMKQLSILWVQSLFQSYVTIQHRLLLVLFLFFYAYSSFSYG